MVLRSQQMIFFWYEDIAMNELNPVKLPEWQAGGEVLKMET